MSNMLAEVKKRLAALEEAMANSRPSVAQVVATIGDLRWCIETIEDLNKKPRQTRRSAYVPGSTRELAQKAARCRD